MDPIDAKLLEILQEDSRATFSSLSKKLSLSRPSVKERILRLQEKGIIENFTLRISMPAVGRDTLLFIQLSSIKMPRHQLEEVLIKEQGILECHRVTGPVDYIIKASVSGMNGISELLERLLPLGDLNTSVVQFSPVPYRHIALT